MSMEPRYCEEAGGGEVSSAARVLLEPLEVHGVRKKRRRTHVGFVRARLKDELLRLMVPVLDGGVRRRQAGGPQGQSGLSMPLLIEVLPHKNEVH